MPWSWKRKLAPRKSREDKQREDTERIAYKVYQNRLLLSRSGDAKSDWETAEKIVRSPWRTTVFAINRPLIKTEKCLFEPFSRHLKNSAVFDIVDRLSPSLEAIGVLLIPLALYLATQAYEQQREAQESERLQQETVQNYIAQLSEIFLNVEGDLRADKNQEIRTIATAATITMLRDPNLNEERKGQVIEFLSQMDLVQGSAPTEENAEELPPIIRLRRADLSEAVFGATDLRYANGLTSEKLTGEDSPYLCNVALSSEITDIDLNRDCDQLEQVLMTRGIDRAAAQEWVSEIREYSWDGD